MTDYPYIWRVRTRLPERFGTRCRVLVRGAMNSALVQFESDGYEVITSRNYLRKPPVQPPARPTTAQVVTPASAGDALDSPMDQPTPASAGDALGKRVNGAIPAGVGTADDHQYLEAISAEVITTSDFLPSTPANAGTALDCDASARSTSAALSRLTQPRDCVSPIIPVMRHVLPEHVDTAISGVVTMMKRAFLKLVERHPQRGETVVPQIAVLCTVDPTTGTAFESLGVVIVSTQLDGDEDEVKDKLVNMARMIAVAGEAAATVVCLDTWVVTKEDAADAMKRSVRPSQHPRRREAMCVVVEKRGETTGSIEHHPYHRLDDGIAFDDSEREDGCDLQGRFAGIVPPRITPRQASAARMLLSMGACGKIAITEIE